jgi:hypothetical protein
LLDECSALALVLSGSIEALIVLLAYSVIIREQECHGSVCPVFASVRLRAMADEDYQERQTPFTEDYPRFVQENDEYAFRFGPIDGAEKEVKKIEDDEGTEIHITLNDDMLVEFRFAQSKIDRFVL